MVSTFLADAYLDSIGSEGKYLSNGKPIPAPPQPPEKDLADYPIVGRAFTKPERDRALNEIYEIATAAKEVVSTVTSAQTKGDWAKFEKLLADPEIKKQFYAYPGLKGTLNNIAAAQNLISLMTNSTDPANTPKVKRLYIENQKRWINQSAREGLTIAKDLGLDI